MMLVLVVVVVLVVEEEEEQEGGGVRMFGAGRPLHRDEFRLFLWR